MKNKKRYADAPWVFWLKVSVRKDWFSYWWSTRGSNFREFQVWIFKISVGRPWLQTVLDAHNDFPGAGVQHVNRTNESFKLSKWVWLMNKK